jgi:hypothetical protein
MPAAILPLNDYIHAQMLFLWEKNKSTLDFCGRPLARQEEVGRNQGEEVSGA